MRVGLFSGLTPSTQMHMSPSALSLQHIGPRLNTEGRSGGLAHIVNCMLGMSPSNKCFAYTRVRCVGKCICVSRE